MGDYGSKGDREAWPDVGYQTGLGDIQDFSLGTEVKVIMISS